MYEFPIKPPPVPALQNWESPAQISPLLRPDPLQTVDHSPPLVLVLKDMGEESDHVVKSGQV